MTRVQQALVEILEGHTNTHTLTYTIHISHKYIMQSHSHTTPHTHNFEQKYLTHTNTHNTDTHTQHQYKHSQTCTHTQHKRNAELPFLKLDSLMWRY